MEKEFLSKIAEFTTLAISEIGTLRKSSEEKIHSLELEKQAHEDWKDTYEISLIKAAKSLYESDFITDESERKNFIKKAKEDPTYLAKVIEKVCNAADVSLIGKPARVAARSKEAEYDPVMARAFGLNSSTVTDLTD